MRLLYVGSPVEVGPLEQRSIPGRRRRRAGAAGLVAVLLVALAAARASALQLEQKIMPAAPAAAPSGGQASGAGGAAPGEAAASGGDLDLRVRAGWGGAARYQGSLPVVAEIANRGADAELELEVLLRADVSPDAAARGVKGPVLGAVARRVALARGERKQVVLHAPVPGGGSVEVRLARGGEPLVSVTPRVQFLGDSFVGILSERPGAFASLREAGSGAARWTVRAVPLTPETFPASVLDLATFDAIVVDGFDPAALDAAQRAALLAWVRRGGTLIIGTGPQGRRALELPAEQRPPDTTRLGAAASLAGLARFGGAPAAAAPVPVAVLTGGAGTVIAAERADGTGLPLLLEVPLGEGRFLVSALSLSAEPLAGWAGRDRLLAELLGRNRGTPWGGPWNAGGEIMERFGFLGWMARSLPSAAFPSPRRLGYLLLAFVLAAGPVNYLVLRRLDRRDWAWVTVPALSLAAVAGIYALALGRDGRDVLVNAVSALELEPAAGVAREEAYVAIFAPTRGELAVDVPAGVGVRPMPVFYGGPFPDANLEEPPYRLVRGVADRIEFGPRTRWQARIVQLSRDVRLRGGIRGGLRVEGTMLRGRIANDTVYRLEDAGVILGDAFVRLGELAPGDSREVELPLPDPAAGFKGGGIGWRFFRPEQDVPQDVPGKSARPSPPPPPLSVEQQQRVQLLDGYFNGKGRGMPGFAPLTFFGFTRDAAPDVPVPGPARHRYALGLVVQPLEVEWAPGPFTVPRHLAAARFTDLQGSGGGSPWEMQLQNGSVVAELRLPLPAGARVERLTLFVDASLMPGGPFDRGFDPARKPLTDRTLQIYDWRTGTWDPLPGRKEIAVDRPADRVSADGLIRVRFNADQGPMAIRMPAVEASGFLPEGGAVRLAPAAPFPGGPVGIFEKVGAALSSPRGGAG